MAQTVSTKFANAQRSDANLPVAKIQLVLGNYCNAAAYGTTAGGSGQQANYPYLGAVDGDRTEINVGAAATADNDIGQSSWRSTAIPTGIPGTPANLNVFFTQSRTINRIKLYHLSGHALTSYIISTREGKDIISTSDIAEPGTVIVTTTGELDIIDFPDETTGGFVVGIYGVATPGDFANIVEVEAYRLIDVTDRVKSVKVSRQRDYKLSNPMAATVQIGCINADRFFSVSHTPTTAEIAEGFVNTELQPGVGILVEMGFNIFTAEPETVTVFTGEIDSITISPISRDAVIQGRDIMKHFINRIDSTKLKTSRDIGANIQYVLNRSNVSDYEMDIDTTGINIDYFFSFQQAALDTIRDLVQAAGDAAFFVNELGISTFRDYTGSITNEHIYTSEIDWESGALINISTLGVYANQLAVPPQYIPVLASGALAGDMNITGGNLSLNSSPAYNGDSFDLGGGSQQTVFTNIGTVTPIFVCQPYNIPRAGTITSVTVDGWQIAAGKTARIEIWGSSGGIPLDPSPGVPMYASSNFTGNQGTITVSPALHVSAGLYFIVVHANSGTAFSKVDLAPTSDGSRVAYTLHGTTWAFVTIQPNATTNFAGICSALAFTYDAVSASGTFASLWFDTASLAVGLSPTVGDVASYPAGTASTVFLDGGDDGSTAVDTYSVANLNGTNVFSVANHQYWRIRVSATATDNVNPPVIGSLYLLMGLTGTWISPVLDTGASTSSLGSVTDTRVLNGGTIAYSTRTSDNGIVWDPYVATSPTGVILSTVRRYIQTMVVIGLGSGGVTPLILDITVSWVSGTGSPKYPAISSFTFSFDSSLIDVKQELADNLGGDSSILNDITVQAQPLVITGTDADTVWQGTIGTPPSNISGGTPKSVLNGDVIVISPVISEGMDISRMSGTNPAAAVVTFAAGAAGSWVFTSIHPTLPVLVITITSAGNINDLRIIGKTFQNASYLLAQNSESIVSIAKYGDRQLSISNQYITATTIAAAIAAVLLSNFQDPTALIPSSIVRLCPALQLGDRVTVSDSNLDLTADYIVVGADHDFEAQLDNASIETDLTLLKVPAGS